MKIASTFHSIIGILLVVGSASLQASSETSLANSTDQTPLQFQPNISGNRLVFVAQGDVWATSRSEKWVARNLTNTSVAESNPKISNDGKWVAYNHPSDGVFVVPFDGGPAKQLTFKGNRGAVLGWTCDGKIAYVGEESAPFPDSAGLSFVRPTGGQPEHTGIAEIGYAWFDRNGRDMIYSKSFVSTGLGAKFHGGKANQILRFNLRTGKYENLFPSNWSRHSAVVVRGIYYFIGTEGENAINLWRMSDSGSEKLTHFAIDGIRNLTSDGESVVVEAQGTLFEFDSRLQVQSPIPIVFPGLEKTAPNATFQIGDSLTEVDVTFDGKTAAVVSRGEIFVSSEKGFENISNKSGANDCEIVWSDDGTQLAFISDASGEQAIYVWNRKTRQTTLLTTCTRRPVWIEWSPKGDGLYYLLDREAIHWVDATTGADEAIAEVNRWTTSHSSSPSGRYLAITTALENKRTSALIIDRTAKQTMGVTDQRYVDTACMFDSQEDVLYFLSRRNGRPIQPRVLALAGGMSLARIDLRNIPNITRDLDFRSLTQWIGMDGIDVEEIRRGPTGLLLSGKAGDFAFDRGSMTVRSIEPEKGARTFPSVSGGARAVLKDGAIVLETWDEGWKPTESFSIKNSFEIQQDLERESMFWFAHRFHRDQFYDPKMLGVDWEGVGKHYTHFLPRVRDREELSVVLARMIGEIPGGHNGLDGPDASMPPPRKRAPHTGLIVGWDGMGAKVLRVLRGRTDMTMFGSLASGVERKVKEGEYIRSVNGRPITESVGLDELSIDTTPTDTVTMQVSDAPNGPMRSVEVKFLGNYLGYNDFLDRTIERVATLTNGRIGYVHVFDTNSQGGGSFSDGFYSQFHLDGLIVDARWNRGGNSNPGFLDALEATATLLEVKRYGAPSMDTPTMKGPIAMLVNKETVSGGDLLAFAFQARSVGTLIGDRTSGRTIGNQWYGRMIDGSSVRTSESRNVSWKDGRDTGENEGVKPDIEVEMLPSMQFSTHDAQLERAVRFLLSKMK